MENNVRKAIYPKENLLIDILCSEFGLEIVFKALIAIFKKVRTELNENGHSIAMRKPAQKILLGDSIKCISDSLI